MHPKTRARVLSALIWGVCLAPLLWLVVRFREDGLGANPIEEFTHWGGTSTLILLLLTLAVTPLRRWAGWNLVRYRRRLGLAAFFYGLTHFMTYLALDQFFAFEYVLEDIAERPYITAGFAAFVLLIPLAVTSTRGWIRRLGRRWQRLHRIVYLAAGLGVLHYFWKVKADTLWPMVAAVVLAVLLASRLKPKAARRGKSLIILVASAWGLTPSPMVAQSDPGAEADQQAILQVVDDLFDAMRARDGETLERIFHPDTRLITAGTNADGVPEVTEIPISRFISSVLASSSYLDERIYNPVVQVNNNLGTVWVEYDFFADGEFSHCGADAFTMGRSADGWQIVQIAHTMVREGCPERGG